MSNFEQVLLDFGLDQTRKADITMSSSSIQQLFTNETYNNTDASLTTSDDSDDSTSSSQLFLNLTYQCLVIFFGSFVVGSLPLWIPINEKFMNYLTLFGAVLLTSFILVIIVPEGFDTLVDAYPEDASVEFASAGGISLIAGFFVIFLIDVFFGLHGELEHSHDNRVGDLDASMNETDIDKEKQNQNQTKSRMLSAGLIFHSTCDGISLGAATYSNNTDLILGIFIGIFCHKLVVGLAMTINLLEKCSKKLILLYLFIFSIAAPIGAFVVLGILVGIDAASDSIVPGILILVSAGTLIYVGLSHSLPEAIERRKLPKRNTNKQSSMQTGSYGMDNLAAVDDQEEMVEREVMDIKEINDDHGDTRKIDFIDFGLILIAVLIPIMLTLFADDG